MIFSNTFNDLNQNVETTPGGTLAMIGRVNYIGGTVVVNNVQAQLSPDLFFAATGIPFVLGTNILDAVFTDPYGRSTNQEATVVVAPRGFEYDANGNLTNDGRLAYTWNDENRLVAIHDLKDGALIQENQYDGLGRRRVKVDYVEGVGMTNRYIYQNWLVLAVTDGSGTVLETYTHGADLSGSVGGGAGGIGGILASTQNGEPAYYHYDFNGNIVQVTTSNQTISAKYTYSPFGEVLIKEGSFQARYQFSSKEYDEVSGLNYYGYRFYSPELGRWINRDPIEERGGLNVYGFVLNASVNLLDLLGLETKTIIIRWTARNSTGGPTAYPVPADTMRYQVSYDVDKSCNRKAPTIRISGVSGNMLGRLDSIAIGFVGVEAHLDHESSSTTDDANCSHGASGNKQIVEVTFTVSTRVGFTLGIGPIGLPVWGYTTESHSASVTEEHECCTCDP